MRERAKERRVCVRENETAREQMRKRDNERWTTREGDSESQRDL